jgi:hypothetical protein
VGITLAVLAAMAIFRHPHLIRGIVHTPYGAFAISRGYADIPEEIGEALGWARTDDSRAELLLRRDTPESAFARREQLDAR